jgi:hypothetical protein
MLRGNESKAKHALPDDGKRPRTNKESAHDNQQRSGTSECEPGDRRKRSQWQPGGQPAATNAARAPDSRLRRGRENTTLPKTFTITDSGRGVLSGAVGAFVNGSPFSVSQGAGAFTLQPHQVLTIGVLFAPAATGRVTALLAITVNAPSTPASGNVTVAGRGS